MAARSTKGAPFPTPGPLSIVHVQEYGSEDVISNDIFAAGRIPSILHYDRRKLPVVKTAIHSGASLSSLASLPYPFPALKDYSHLCDGPARTSQATWRTVVACGEYKSKGSLELYPIDEGDGSSPMVNRQTSSSAKIFSVVSHGRQLALSDGAGCIRWFERDGFTEVRRCHLGSDDYADEGDKEEEDERRMAAEALGRRPDHTDSRRNGHLDSETGDIARKLLVTKAGSIGGAGKGSFENSDLLFWTGDKLGLVTFSPKPGSRAADFNEDDKTAAERAMKMEGDIYRARMRRIFQSARYFGENSDSDD
ncbi:hypothetical protein SEPCBS119000_005050 [Sporothrix epigloea]|uniref:F-box domain containing protein n=1 Tax=Sporothrix epigloea TaxID=1892477 RepID=A0ABP0DVS9_9PEZI